jgi:hypothetical protein
MEAEPQPTITDHRTRKPPRRQHGANHIYEVLSYKPLGKSLFLLGGVLFVALPCLYGILFFETRVCLYLSGALTTVQPDHQPLTPEPQPLSRNASGGTAATAAGPAGAGAAAGAKMLSPTSIKLVEAEMGVGFEHDLSLSHPGASMHHRPHPHMHMGGVQGS